MDTKIIYILYAYQPGDEGSTAVGWSESEDELKELKTQLEKNPECPYGEERRSKIDSALVEWAEIEEHLYDEAVLRCPYYKESRIPHVLDTKRYGKYLDMVEQECKHKRAEWFSRYRPTLTTPKELIAYDEFLERENDHTGYYIAKLNHV